VCDRIEHRPASHGGARGRVCVFVCVCLCVRVGCGVCVCVDGGCDRWGFEEGVGLGRWGGRAGKGREAGEGGKEGGGRRKRIVN
jgi:hypothetical protein